MPPLSLPALGRTLAVLALATLGACAHSAHDPAAAVDITPAQSTIERWLADVTAMSAADTNLGRRAVIRSRLDGIALPWRNESFEASGQSGENILARVSGRAEAPLLLIGAHSDRVEAGRGATDNASGSAVVLALAERFKLRPLARHRVEVAFWDLEESGLLGAHAYVAQGKAPPTLYVNLDVFGWGDSLWMMTPDPAHPLVASTREAAETAGLALSAGDAYPPTDHLAFLEADWPAVSYSLVGADEIPLILEVFAGKKPISMPKVMQVIHSEEDTVAHLDAAAVVRGVDAIESALRRWDDASAPTAD